MSWLNIFTNKQFTKPKARLRFAPTPTGFTSWKLSHCFIRIFVS